MKVSIRLLLSFSLLAPIFAHTQAIPQGTFQHIIIVVQENRTPDNLFGSAPAGSAKCGSADPFEPGVDIDNGGYGTPPNGTRQEICNISEPLNAGFSPDHHYDDTANHGYGWLHQYDVESS